MEKLCRTCLVEYEDPNEVISLYESIQCGDEFFKISRIIAMCTGIEISQSDDLTNEICLKCLTNLKNAYNFRTQCWSSEVELKTSLKQLHETKKSPTVPGEKREKTVLFEWNEESDVASEIDELPSVPSEPPLKVRKKYTRKVPLPIKLPNKSVCELCGKISNTMQNHREHMKTHTGERPYACEYCDFRSARKASIIIHTRMHTGEKPFECDICGNRFQTASGRRGHRKTHFDDRPYACPICQKAFKQMGAMREHSKIHDVTKHKKCQYCDRMFVKREALKYHEMLHLNKRPHKCEVCEKGFIQRSYLKVHMRSCALKNVL